MDALTQSLCSLDSTMTTGALLDARRTAVSSYTLRRDGICSQHDRRDALSSPIVLAIYRWNAPMSGFVRARPRSLGLHVTEPIAVGEKNVWFAVPMSGPGLTGLKLPLGAST